MSDTALIDSQQATEAEVAAAQAEAVAAQEKQAIKTGDRVPDAGELKGAVKPLQYRIPEADAAAWVMIWELKIDAQGNEYGIPRRAPRGQLGLWLHKKREVDGGTRFVVDQPERIAAEPQYPCLHRECRKKLYFRQDVVDHVENCHPREARLYRKLLDQMLEQAMDDNPRVKEIAQTIINTQEKGIQSVVVNPKARQGNLDLQAGAPTVSSFGIPKVDGEVKCLLCPWVPKGENLSDERKTHFLKMHLVAKHKDELE